jgi:AraC-like DNA-binding protein
MKSDYYILILDIVSIVSVFAGIIMFFFSSEQKKKLITYKRSRYIAGVIFLLYAILCFVHSNFEWRSINKLHASAFSLLIYYMSGTLFGYSLIPLLKKDYFNRHRIMVDSVRALLFVGLIVGTLLLDDPYSKIALALSAVYFFTDMMRVSTVFVKSYRMCVADIDNYYSEYHVKNYVDWMFKLSIFVIVYGLSFTFVVYTNTYFIGAFSFIGIFLMAYIVVSFNNYLINVEKIDLSKDDGGTENGDKITTGVDSLVYAEIGDKLQEWVEQKRFLNEGVTIVMLCADLNTNRTYLSYYINNTYNCSFRNFISELRVAEAKRLLQEDISKDIEEIAQLAGFSSTSNFYRSFKLFENQTPVAYRNALGL